MGKLKIFISSTIEELEEERHALADSINNKMIWEAIHAEAFVARSESPRMVCLEELNYCHIYIGIFREKYGFIPEKDNETQDSATIIEYREAINMQIPIFIFIDKRIEDREQKLKNFLKTITDFNRGHHIKQYSSTEELLKHAFDSINNVITRGYLEYQSIKNMQNEKHLKDIFDAPMYDQIKQKENE